MGLTLSDSGKKFELCPPGLHKAKCYAVIDIGSHKNAYGKEPRQIIIIWELDQKMEDGRPFVISKFYNAYFGKEASIRLDLESWRGRNFTEQELKGFSVKNIVGANCYLNIIQSKEQDGKERNKISSIVPLPKDVPPLEMVNDPVCFDLDEFDEQVFDALPDWIKTKIKASPEYLALGNFAVPNLTVSEEDGIPF